MNTLILLVFALIAAFSFALAALIYLRRMRASQRANDASRTSNRKMAEVSPSRRYPLVMPTWNAQIALIVSIALWLSGLFMIVIGWMIHQDNVRQVQLLESEGVVTTAPVTDKSISESDDSRTYYVHYSLVAPVESQPQQFQHKERVSKSFYDRVEQGSKIEVVYVRSDPSIARIRALYVPGKIEYWYLLGLGGGGLVSWSIACLALGQHRRARRLDEEGMPITVSVLDLYEKADSEGTSYYVAYELPDVGPIRHTISRKRYAQLRVGDPIRLVYLPDRPKTFRVQWD